MNITSRQIDRISWVAIFVAVLFLLGLSNLRPDVSAAINKWIYIAGTKTDRGLYYDRESIIPISGNVNQLWIKRIDKNSSEIRVLVEVDCANKIIRDTQIVVEKPSAAASSLNRDRTWRSVVRGTPEGDLFRVICRIPAPESYKKP
jgi:hypothetical protein